MKTSTNYFEQVYLGKKNDRVSAVTNRRLQQILPSKAITDNTKVDLTVFRKKSQVKAQAEFELLLEKW